MKIFHLPDLGEGLAEAEIREWYIKEGDSVQVDQPIVSMETAKAVVDVPSPYDGKIIKLYGKPNDIIKTHAPLVGFEAGQEEQTAAKHSVVGALEESSGRLIEDEVIIGKPKSRAPSIKALPAARVLAKEMQVDLTQVSPTGPNGLITVDDVKQFLGKHKSSAGVEIEGEALRGVRRAMAAAMSESHQNVVPVTIIEDADITNLANKKDLTVKLLKAMVVAAERVPELNAWFDGKNLTRKLCSEINIGLAVDSAEGLFVPVIRDIPSKDEQQLRQAIDEFKQGVYNRTVAPAAMQGATITLSNFGTITGRYATPIIIPPMVAILGVGRARSVPVIREGKIVEGHLLPLSLTFDHRAVTGGEATRFLGEVIQYLTG